MDSHRTALILFAVALAVAVLAASITTLENTNTRQVSSDVAPDTTGLARPHPPLDRAPGQPIQTER